MLGLVSPRDLPEKTLGLLVMSRLVRIDNRHCEITPEGFKFVMKKPEEQVSTLVMKYIELSHDYKRDIVNVYKTIFALTLTRYEDLYRVGSTADITSILEDFDDLGLVSLIERGGGSGRLFKISYLLSQFLGIKTASTSGGGGGGLVDLGSGEQLVGARGLVDETERFLIVQTNYKVFAYTESRLFLAILQLFLNIEIKLPGLVIGSLTHKSVRNAFLKGIRAKDISNFLDARSIDIKSKTLQRIANIAFTETAV